MPLPLSQYKTSLIKDNDPIKLKKLECNSLYFNGINSYINCGNNVNLTFGLGNFTVSAWVKIESITSSTYPVIIGKGDTAADEWMFRLTTGILEVYGASNNIATCNYPLSYYNIWKHCLFVRNGDDGYIYIDGKQKGHSNGIAGYNFSTNKNLLIGNGDLRADRYFPGFINNISIYNYALSINEINKLSISKNISSTGLVLNLYMKSNYSTKKIIKDKSGNNNDGTLHNCKWNCHWKYKKYKEI